MGVLYRCDFFYGAGSLAQRRPEKTFRTPRAARRDALQVMTALDEIEGGTLIHGEISSIFSQ